MTIKLEVGKSYKTKGGWKAIIIDDDGTSTPLYIKHYTPDGVSDIWHYKSGKCNILERDYDLIAEWEEEVDLTKIETPFRLLDKNTQDRLKAHGGPFQYFHNSGWVDEDSLDTGIGYWVWRVKPKPIVEYKNTDYVYSKASGVGYIITEKFVDGKYDSYTVDMVPF